MSTKTKFYKLLTGMMLLSSVTFAQPKLLEFTLNNLTGSGVVSGSGFGPRTTNHVVYFDKDRLDNGKMDLQSATPDPISTPYISATISLQNQQYTGFTYGSTSPYPISTGLVFGAGPSTAFGGPPPQQVTPLNSYDILGAFNGGGGPRNGMFMSNYANPAVANYPTGSGTGIDAEGLLPSPATDANGGVQVFTCAQRMYDLNSPAGTADRYYYGDLVIQFNRYIAVPVIHIAGLGGSYRYSLAGQDPTNIANWRSTFFSTELELVGPGSITKLAGNQFLTVSGKNILNNAATPNGESFDVGAVALPNWNNFGAATGSVRIGVTTNQLRFKIWLRGSDANALPSGFNWSAPGSASGGSRDPLTGDIWYISVSAAQPQLIPLPSTGVTLTAALNGNDVGLNWKTVTELNSKQFEIERSTDGINFTQVGVKAAAGYSTSQLYYYFTDPNMNSNVYYYRLKIVDLDGKYTYSNVAVVRKAGGIKGVRAFPNPATENVNLEFSNAKGDYVISVLNQAGQEMRSSKVTITSTVQYVSIEKGNLATGSYLIRARNSNTGETFVERVILQN